MFVHFALLVPEAESALIWRAAKRCHSNAEQSIRHAPAGHCANDDSVSHDNALPLRQGFGFRMKGDSVRSSGHRIQTFSGCPWRLTGPRGARAAKRRHSHTETGLQGLLPPIVSCMNAMDVVPTGCLVARS